MRFSRVCGWDLAKFVDNIGPNLLMRSSRVWGWDLQPFFIWDLAKWSERLTFFIQGHSPLGMQAFGRDPPEAGHHPRPGLKQQSFWLSPLPPPGPGQAVAVQTFSPRQSFRQELGRPQLTAPFTASSACVFATLCAAVCGSKEDRRPVGEPSSPWNLSGHLTTQWGATTSCSAE